LTQNFQHYGPCKFFWKNKKTLHSDLSSHIKDGIMQDHEQKQKVKKVKNQYSMGKNNFFLSTMSFSPWAILPTWLLVGTPQKI
jgi:hypothetical protein